MGWRRAKAGRWSESTIEHRHPRQRPGVCCRPRGRRLAATVAAITTTSGAAWHWRITDGDGTDVESLRREFRRLRAEVLGPGDAFILADVLRTDGHRFRPLRPPSDDTRAASGA